MRRLLSLLSVSRSESEVDEELQYHLERQIEQNVADGMSTDEARRAAMREFGGLQQSKENCREARGGRLVEELWMDLKFGARMLWKNPGFTVIALLTLSLGIGASTAIFSVVNGVMLTPLNFPAPERLVVISETSKEVPVMTVAYPNYLDWRAQQTLFENLAARLPAGGVLTGDGEPERVTGRFVTASFFPTLGVQPHIGRFFTEDEDTPGAARVIVLGYGLWQRRFGGDPQVIHRTIQYNGESWEVVGVSPAEFDFYGQSNPNNEFFIPLGHLANQDFMLSRSSHPVTVLGRIKPGVELGQAQSEMSAIAARLSSQYPASNSGNNVTVRSLMDDYVGGVRPALLMLLVAVLLVLLISCANITNLLLARATVRRKEVALRLALGARRSRIVRQLLTETLLLASVGGILGLLLGFWLVELLLNLRPAGLPRIEHISMDWRVLAFTLLATVLSGALTGLLPAFQLSQSTLSETLKEGAQRSSGSMSGRNWRAALVISEVALSMILLVGAGLLIKSFWRLMQVEMGFDAEKVLTLRLRLPDAKYPDAQKAVSFLNEVSRRVETLHGVQHVSLATGFPFGRSSQNGYWLEGQPEPKMPGEWPVATTHSVGEDYHHALSIKLLAGRYLTEFDTANSPPVVIVDDDFVRRHFPNRLASDALGKRLRFGGEGEPWREIVGVVQHAKQSSLDEVGHPGIYRPWTQMNLQRSGDYLRSMDLLVKTAREPANLIPLIRREVQVIDKDQPLGNVRTLESLVADSVAPRRFSLLVLAVFAVSALALGAVGLYGVLSYLVTQRTREIGIRMALGAQAGDITKLVMNYGIRLALAGITAGILLALALTRLMGSLLFGVGASDPPTFMSVILLLLIVTLSACYLPARKAVRVDPLIALRNE